MKNIINNKIRNPYAIISIFVFLYMVIPAFVLNETSDSYAWKFTEYSIMISQCISFFYFLFFISLSLITKPLNFEFNSDTSTLQIGALKIFLIGLLFFISLSFFINFEDHSNKLINDGYTGKDTNDISLYKTIAYLMVPIAAILNPIKFCKKISLCLIVLLLCAIDFLNGTRTIGYIAISAIILPKLITDKSSSYILPAIFMSALYSMALFFRVDNAENVEAAFFVKNLGEFRETFNSLVYLISNNFPPTYDFLNIVEMIGIGILGPLRFILTPDIPGVVVMNYIDKGYGFGFLFATEGYYYLGFLGIILWPILMAGIVELLKKTCFKDSLFGFVEYLLFCVMARLFIREGIVVYIPFFFYLSFIYMCFLELLKSKPLNVNKRTFTNTQI